MEKWKLRKDNQEEVGEVSGGRQSNNGKQFWFREGRSCAVSLISFYPRVFGIVKERNEWA